MPQGGTEAALRAGAGRRRDALRQPCVLRDGPDCGDVGDRRSWTIQGVRWSVAHVRHLLGQALRAEASGRTDGEEVLIDGTNPLDSNDDITLP